ncbi:MAG: ribonuclease E inhibitor RraB [Pseudomonadota bacterium]
MSEDEGGSDWDFVTQRNETAWTVHHLNTEKGVALGTPITLDLHLEPQDDADEDALLRALAMFGYTAEAVTSEETAYVQVTVPEVAFDVEAIWTHEERVTKIALTRGFAPDGWGFWEP